MNKKIVGELIDHRIIVWDIEDAKKLYKNGFFGKYMGIKLSLIHI